MYDFDKPSTDGNRYPEVACQRCVNIFLITIYNVYNRTSSVPNKEDTVFEAKREENLLTSHKEKSPKAIV